MATKPPRIDPAVVDWLAGIFRNECPAEADTDRAIWMAVGAQRVVRRLRSAVNTQSDTLLTDDNE